MGRILILEKDPNRAFQKLFNAWFEPKRTSSPDTFIPVEQVSRILLDGTLELPIQRVLRVRVEEMLHSWGHQVPSDGLNYRITARDSRKGRK